MATSATTTPATATVGDAVNWTKGAYTLYLGPWGAGALVRGKDYADSATLSPDTFPNGVAITWRWPSAPAVTTGVYNFNAIDFGNYSTNLTSAVAPSQVRDIGALRQTHSFTLGGDPAQSDVITDFWLTGKPNDFSTKLFEVEVALHVPAYAKAYFQSATPVGTYTDAGGLAWSVTLNNGAGHVPVVLIMRQGGADLTAGTVDLKGMLDWLTSRGVIAGTEYFNGLAMGAEVRQGAGSLTVDALDVAYSLGGSAPVIDSNGGGARAAVNVVAGTTTVTSVHAADADGTAPRYSIAGGADAALFTIDAKTGALSFKAAPVYAAPKDAGGDNVYDVTVQASDGAHADTQALAVTVGAPPAAPGPATYALTREAYDGQWHLTAYARQTETVRTEGAQQTVQFHAADGTLKAIVQTSTTGATDTVRAYDAAWRFTGADVITRGAQTVTDHLDASGRLTGRDVFSLQGGKAVEQHFDAAGRFTGTDVASVDGARSVVRHLNAAGAMTGYDTVTTAEGKLATQHYDAAGHFLGAEAVTLTAVQAANHDPMTAWLIG